MKLLTPHDGPKTPKDQAAHQYSEHGPSSHSPDQGNLPDIGGKVNTRDGSKRLIPKILPGSDFPHKPPAGSSIDLWFDYYHQCRLKGFAYTLRDLAEDTGYKISYIKLLHRQYLIEHQNE